MMSSPVCLGFSGPVMSVLIVGNPTTPRDCIDAPRKSCAEPVGRKSAPISCMPTPDTSKPLNVASRVIGTFLEDTCFELHLGKTHAGKPVTDSQSSVCSQRRRCPTCYQQNVGLSNIERHLCWHVDCPSCHEYVHADDHLCFIQRAPQDKKKRKRKHVKEGPRAKRGAAATAEPHAPEEEEEEDDLPPLHVFFDIEAMQPQEKHIANLVVAETEDDDPPQRFSGPFCIRDFPGMVGYLDTP